MTLRRRMRRAFEEGLQVGRLAADRFPLFREGVSRYERWAYYAGVEAGRREVEQLAQAVERAKNRE